MTDAASEKFVQAGGVEDKHNILILAQTCETLFSKYADPQLPSSDTRARAKREQQRFHCWVSDPFNVSLDKRLEYSDELRSLVVQLLSLMHRNLEFGK
ncbi:hypothetical protein NW767_015522 [Fusarium falciforme]|nr:hypothetical protein NW767_015522 [Fusarium falciforme]KAJ4220328.1 hypothetical protein NW757_014514 [Fusarium falciforme]